MKAVVPKTNPKKAGVASERRRLLKEFFLNASLLAVMKETVEEAVELDRVERAVAREEERAISAPAA
ncbi:MAG: hypothetical protein ACI9UA_002552 [Pseudoalteromonas tetraodonis]|jgi:hypothetical protein